MLKELFSRRKKETPTLPPERWDEGEQGPALSQDVTFGEHLYRRAGDVAEVIFTHRKEHIRRVLVDNDGMIQDFPGFEDPEGIRCHIKGGELPGPQVRFRTNFTKVDGDRFKMVWEVQPDGRYWEDDDGFGGTSDAEVKLYAYIDRQGRFTAPFRLYKVGVTYCDKT